MVESWNGCQGRSHLEGSRAGLALVAHVRSASQGAAVPLVAGEMYLSRLMQKPLRLYQRDDGGITLQARAGL